MSRPTLSAIVPNYNHARFLHDSLGSLVRQSRPPDELIVLDDGSTDDSAKIIKEYAQRHAFIRFLRHEKNQGANASFQRLFETVTGDYVFAGAADDVYLPDFFQRAMEMAEQHSAAGLVCGKMGVMDERGRELVEIGIRRWQQPLYAKPDQVLDEYLEVEAPSHSLCASTIYRRDALAEVGWYQQDLESWGDTFSARAVALKYGMCYVPDRFATWRRLAGSFSGAGRADAEFTLGLVAKAARLMQGDKFRDRFPAAHVRRWEQRYRRLAIWNDWMGEGMGCKPASPSFWLRVLRRLPKLPRAIRLAWYRPPV